MALSPPPSSEPLYDLSITLEEAHGLRRLLDPGHFLFSYTLFNEVVESPRFELQEEEGSIVKLPEVPHVFRLQAKEFRHVENMLRKALIIVFLIHEGEEEERRRRGKTQIQFEDLLVNIATTGEDAGRWQERMVFAILPLDLELFQGEKPPTLVVSVELHRVSDSADLSSLTTPSSGTPIFISEIGSDLSRMDLSIMNSSSNESVSDPTSFSSSSSRSVMAPKWRVSVAEFENNPSFGGELNVRFVLAGKSQIVEGNYAMTVKEIQFDKKSTTPLDLILDLPSMNFPDHFSFTIFCVPADEDSIIEPENPNSLGKAVIRIKDIKKQIAQIRTYAANQEVFEKKYPLIDRNGNTFGWARLTVRSLQEDSMLPVPFTVSESLESPGLFLAPRQELPKSRQQQQLNEPEPRPLISLNINEIQQDLREKYENAWAERERERHLTMMNIQKRFMDMEANLKRAIANAEKHEREFLKMQSDLRLTWEQRIADSEARVRRSTEENEHRIAMEKAKQTQLQEENQQLSTEVHKRKGQVQALEEEVEFLRKKLRDSPQGLMEIEIAKLKSERDTLVEKINRERDDFHFQIRNKDDQLLRLGQELEVFRLGLRRVEEDHKERVKMESFVVKERFEVAEEKRDLESTAKELAKTNEKIQAPIDVRPSLLRPQPFRNITNNGSSSNVAKKTNLRGASGAGKITATTARKLEEEKFDLLKIGCSLDHPIIRQIDRLLKNKADE